MTQEVADSLDERNGGTCQTAPHPQFLTVLPLPQGEGQVIFNFFYGHNAGPNRKLGKPVASQGNKQRRMIATTIQRTYGIEPTKMVFSLMSGAILLIT